ncbi:MAG: metalloregulator ArsR/SmtB family transcription factor [Acholeplasmataceae bacterium]
MQGIYFNYSLIFKALSDETRLKIIDMLSCGELCACDILDCVDISQSTLSYHMKVLTEAKLVDGRKDGSWVRYSLNEKNKDQLISFLTNLMEDKESCICKDFNNEFKNCCVKGENIVNEHRHL